VSAQTTATSTATSSILYLDGVVNVQPGCVIILTVPNKLGTFDYGRPYTTFTHILNDFIDDTKENDETHFDEKRSDSRSYYAKI
jgi:hypothetical protein